MSHSDRPDPESVYLENGELAATPEDVFGALDTLGIAHHTLVHEPLYTVEEARTVKYALEGAHTKNLFLRNKKGRMFLLVLSHDQHIALKSLHQQMQLTGGQLSFASTERLGKYLGVVPGSVSPLAVINDHDKRVSVYIEQALLDHESIWLHPCRNTHSTRLSMTGLINALRAWDHTPEIIAFDGPETNLAP